MQIPNKNNDLINRSLVKMAPILGQNMFNSNFGPRYALVNIQIDIVVKLYFSGKTVCTLSLSRSVLSHNTTPRYNTADLVGF